VDGSKFSTMKKILKHNSRFVSCNAGGPIIKVARCST